MPGGKGDESDSTKAKKCEHVLAWDFVHLELAMVVMILPLQECSGCEIPEAGEHFELTYNICRITTTSTSTLVVLNIQVSITNVCAPSAS
jgi:hypothetical protein